MPAEPHSSPLSFSNSTYLKLFLLTFILMAVVLVGAAVFVYYPVNIGASWVYPPVRFQAPTGVPEVTVQLSDDNTSAVVNIRVSNKALHVWDYDSNNRYSAMRNINENLQQNFIIQWDAFITNYSGAIGLQGVEIRIRFNRPGPGGPVDEYYWFYFSYSGGNIIELKVYRSNDGWRYRVGSVQLDMSIPHQYRIVLVRQGNDYYAHYYIDGGLKGSYSITQYATGSNSIICVFAGNRTYNQALYDLYIDNVYMEITLPPTTEDFEDGIDDFFNNLPGSGDTGKEVTNWPFQFQFLNRFLIAHNYDLKGYQIKLSATWASSSVRSADIWIVVGSSTSSRIRIRNGYIDPDYRETSWVLLPADSSASLYLEITPSGQSATILLDFIYRIDGSDAVTVTYPIQIICS